MRRRNFLFLFMGAGWPEAEAETLSGNKVTLPQVFGGKPAVVVWSFSKNAGEKTRDWLEPLTRAGLNAWGAAMLEAAPRFVRPLIRGGMKKQMTGQMQDRQLLLYKDEKGWRGRLGVKDDALPLVVILDGAGGVAWSRAGHFQVNAFSEIQDRLKSLK